MTQCLNLSLLHHLSDYVCFVHFPGATDERVSQSEQQSQSQPSPIQESPNQIIPHTSPDITAHLRVLGKAALS